MACNCFSNSGRDAPGGNRTRAMACTVLLGTVLLGAGTLGTALILAGPAWAARNANEAQSPAGRIHTGPIRESSPDARQCPAAAMTVPTTISSSPMLRNTRSEVRPQWP